MSQANMFPLPELDRTIMVGPPEGGEKGEQHWTVGGRD